MALQLEPAKDVITIQPITAKNAKTVVIPIRAAFSMQPELANHVRFGSEADPPKSCHSARLALRAFSISKRNEGKNRDESCRSERHSGSGKERNQETIVNPQHQAFDQDSDHRDRCDDRVEDQAT